MSDNQLVSLAVAGRARSCTGCRQVKLKCDARKTAPQPCTRCKDKRLQCKFDSNFKRIPMRRVAQQISNAHHNLLSSGTPDPSALSSSKSPAPSAAAASYATPALTFTGPVSTPEQHAGFPQMTHAYQSNRQWLNVSDSDRYVPYVLVDVEMDAETVISLFKHFERYYLPHAPFLANVTSLSLLAAKSPLLFWTITLQASREWEKHDEGLYEQICVAHAVLMSQITHIAIQTVEEVHALLLLCLWPIPKNRGQHDPSWNYINLAISAAMQMNCHDPIPANSIAGSWKGMADQAAAEVPPEIAALTWIHCFQIGVRSAAYLGLPPPVSTGSQLKLVSKAVSNVPSLSEEQRTVAEILRLSCLSTSELDNAEDSQTRFLLIKMFDSQLNLVGQQYHGSWSIELDIDLLAAKLYLYGMIFAMGTDTSTNLSQRDANRQLVLLWAQDAALKYIARMAQLSLPVGDEYPAGVLSFYPIHFFSGMYTAALFLFRFLASYGGVTQQHTTTVIDTGLTEAHKIFQSFVDHRDAIKAAYNIQQLVEILRTPNSFQPYPLGELVVTNRLGASVRFDALFRTAHHRNRNPATGAAPPVSNWIMFNDDPRHIVPMTPEQKALASGTNSSNHGTDDSHSQGGNQMMGPWTGWENYMSDFGIGIDQWGTDVLSQMDPAAHVGLYEAPSSSLPLMGPEQYPGQ